MEAKKMAVSQLISKVKVGRDYDVEIDLNVSYNMFSEILTKIPLEKSGQGGVELAA